MQTDIPLKALTAACAADLLALLGAPEAQVLGVETLELPAAATAVDTVLRLRDQAGREYLHLLEWQGYRDPSFLWRVMGYLSWLGLNRTERPIAVTVVYLSPADDVGATLEQVVGTGVNWALHLSSVRLWEQDAVAAVRTGRLGLAVLSPLMRGATADLVTEVTTLILTQTTAAEQRQADLLTILGIFAAPLVTPERFLQRVGRERLMASEFIAYLIKDEIAEQRAEWDQERQAEQAQREQERQAERAHLEQALRQTVEDTILARFPATPPALVAALGTVHDAAALRQVHHVVLYAPDQGSVEHLLGEITAPGQA